ncbi:CHAT domain-containing protein [Bradyrhizobium guangzhouense]|uniref:CHAT domain-containing protein n=1 Tax=Bradyrhizobium guangzhouense TaxID=1325095 RepID=UPI001009CDC0|nr:CHAT domain-containing protein [Bradyrhizobium guangzhouense]RXH08319.1 CHAT domain-containing protein [Bradyrhizobium guangzhouense]
MTSLSTWALALGLLSAFGGASALGQESNKCHSDIAVKRPNCDPTQSTGGIESKKEGSAEKLSPPSLLPPPPSIADITAILDSEKPDPATLAKMKSAADAEPASELSQAALAQFLYQRSESRQILGRMAEAFADGQQALIAAKSAGNDRLIMRIGMLNTAYFWSVGDLKSGLASIERLIAEADSPQTRGNLFPLHHNAVRMAVGMGDLEKAEEHLQQGLALIQEARSGSPRWRGYPVRRASWECSIAFMRAQMFAARGRFSDAESAFTEARELRLRSIEDFAKLKARNPDVPLVSEQQRQADSFLLNVAEMKSQQGRLAEAELDARRVLFSRLKADGKYNPLTTKYVTGLADILSLQGRFPEAEKLVRTSLHIQRTLGIGDDQFYSATALSSLGSILTGEGKYIEANEVFDKLQEATANWDSRQREALLSKVPHLNALLGAGRNREALIAAQALVEHEIERVGEGHYDSASAHGFLGIALARAGKDAEAIRQFRIALPVLQAAAQENADDGNVKIATQARLKLIVENYIMLMARTSIAQDDVAAQTFAWADAIRGHAVQKALEESSARAAAMDPALAELVRREQDLSKQARAQLGFLNNLLSVPSNQRDESVLRSVEGSLAQLRSDRDAARAEIKERFPAYADLVNPKPPSIDQIREALHDDEAVLSFYFGVDASFVWAVPKSGPVAFASIEARPEEVKRKIKQLRKALDTDAALISDIPPFDVNLGYQLYSLLLKPVENGWKRSRTLIVVTNGALGLLPLSLLPTAPTQVDTDEDVLFASYRKVPWLARTHAVTMVPSLAALLTLRNLPPGKPDRSELIAFGDPYFSTEQQEEGVKATKLADASSSAPVWLATRGLPLKRRNRPKLGVDSAELAMLPRLPDTAEELKAIALALRADPSKALNLGKDANEGRVKTTDLSGFKVVVFATHGLVPGELDGLTEPALALTAPVVWGGEGDGLLTMEEILALKLDADWVVLSACNTGSGEGAGAEAASGLGRAFFYAGTRALLVTNWSVHSQSARELVTDLFKRQADDKKLARGEALRQAMMALVDGPGYVGADGKTEFAYAHPLFWAPYSIIGDGGRR